MPRYDKPQILIDYERVLKFGPPRICHTCFSYDNAGTCDHWATIPPEAFACTNMACTDWNEDIPF